MATKEFYNPTSHWATDRKEARTANSTYPKGGVSCFADTFVQTESSVLRMEFSFKNPALLVAAKRYKPFYARMKDHI